MSGRYFLGIILVVLGTGFLLQQLDVIDFGTMVSVWWPMVIIVLGAYQLIRRTMPILTGVMMILVGALFQARNLEQLPVNLGELFWPLLLIIIGVWVISSKMSGKTSGGNQEDYVKHFIAFGGVETKSQSKQFKGGSITAIFGGADIDLRDAVISEEGAVLELTAAFGGIDVKVPENCRVAVSGVPLFGGWENKAKNKKQDDENLPLVKINCFVMFGGVDVKN